MIRIKVKRGMMAFKSATVSRRNSTGRASVAAFNGLYGFTLIELMIVLSVIAVLSLIAVPAFLKAKYSVQDARFISAVRVASMGFDQYRIQAGRYPHNAPAGVMPEGMADYLQKMGWTNETPLGGQWGWKTNQPSLGPCIHINALSLSDDRMETIDRKIDDGNLNTGRFRKLEKDNGFIYGIE